MAKAKMRYIRCYAKRKNGLRCRKRGRYRLCSIHGIFRIEGQTFYLI